MKPPPIAIDAFSGAGGLSLGLHAAGFEAAVAFDNDQHALTTYAKNLPGATLLRSAEDVSGEELLSYLPPAQRSVALLAGGPPCQGFSRQRRGPDDDDRNLLVGEFLRLVREVQPSAFIMENVAALGGRRGRAALDQLMTGARTAGYEVQAQVVDAVDFGVPQRRKRLFVVGTPPGSSFSYPRAEGGSDTWRTVRDAIGDLPDPFDQPNEARLIANHEPDNISELNRARIRHVPEGGGREDIPVELRLPCHRVSVAQAGHRGVYGRLSWDAPSGTITTRCNSFTRGRFAHPSADRNITMREAARLQGFPDDFVFHGGRVEVAHQIGNAVPPPLATALATAVRRALT